MTTTLSLITFDDLSAVRNIPLNSEHCHAFMRERYLIAGQLVLIAEHGFSQAAIESYPIIENKDFSLERLRAWSIQFMHWRESLSRRDQRIFNSIRFLPTKL